ncbi:hypothetical protein [Candidatus Villigracilis proximus]|uniref:hypothetical protein n=1 Tax=Candidatus Villigracilis proximus TaxID=3140683 RepID=UPI0031F02BC6
MGWHCCGLRFIRPTAVFLRLFEDQNVKITPEDARSGMGLMKKDHLRTILARPQVAEAWIAAHGKPASEDDIDTLFNNFVPLQISVLKEFENQFPDFWMWCRNCVTVI